MSLSFDIFHLSTKISTPQTFAAKYSAISNFSAIKNTLRLDIINLHAPQQKRHNIIHF